MDESAFRTVPTEEEQRETSPHRGHADDLANANGADGVIPDELNDGRGQPGHVTPAARDRPTARGGCRSPSSRSCGPHRWSSSIGHLRRREYRVTVYEWIVPGDFRVEITFFVDALTAVCCSW